jgi:hypothetical protein
MEPASEGHKFNHDLLANEGDRCAVRKLYPTLEQVLYHEELVAYFNKYNDRADTAKKTSRIWGKWAIVLGAIAIVLAAIEIIAEITAYRFGALLIGGVASVCGLASVTIGAFGVLLGARKREWLHNRFMGERIRQFHFQSLIAQLTQVAAVLQTADDKLDQAKTAFLTERRSLFVEFQNQFGGNVDGKFNSVIGPHGEADCWLYKTEYPLAPAEGRQRLETFFKAYRQLRIQHQLDYANYKLEDDHRIFSPMPVRQAKVLEHITNAGIAWLLVIHLTVLGIVAFTVGAVIVGAGLGNSVAEATGVISIIFCVAIIFIAVVALAARAFQQGIQPEREVERYQQYRSAVQSVLDQFDEVDTPTEKIRIIRQMERLAFDEMRNFLRTHDRSSFAI